MANNGRIEITFERERNTLRSLLSFFNRGHRVEYADGNGHGNGHFNGNGRGIVGAPDLSKAQRFLAALDAKHGLLEATATDVRTDSVSTLFFDSTALVALAAGHPRARAYAAWALRSKTRIVVAATAFLDPQAAAVAGNVADVLPIYASTAELAASIVASARIALPFDALTVALAAKLRPAAILTRDPAGFHALTHGADQAGVSIFSL